MRLGVLPLLQMDLRRGSRGSRRPSDRAAARAGTPRSRRRCGSAPARRGRARSARAARRAARCAAAARLARRPHRAAGVEQRDARGSAARCRAPDRRQRLAGTTRRPRRSRTARAARRRRCSRDRRALAAIGRLRRWTGADAARARRSRDSRRSAAEREPRGHRDAGRAACADDAAAFLDRDRLVRRRAGTVSTLPLGHVTSIARDASARCPGRRSAAARSASSSWIRSSPCCHSRVPSSSVHRDARADAVAVRGRADACARAARGCGCRRRCAAAAPGRCWSVISRSRSPSLS